MRYVDPRASRTGLANCVNRVLPWPSQRGYSAANIKIYRGQVMFFPCLKLREIDTEADQIYLDPDYLAKPKKPSHRIMRIVVKLRNLLCRA